MIRRLALSLTAVAAAAGLAAPAAQAGPLVASAPDCSSQVWENPFLPWLDPANYVLAPQGTLEAGEGGWSLANGAAEAAGNETFYVHAPGEDTSLYLPAGSRARTGTMCVGLEHPTLRFFAKRHGGSDLSTLRVDVLLEDSFGNIHEVTIGTTTGGEDWAPTLPMVITASLLPLLPGDHTPVQFRFVPQDDAGWSIDDVYVDPYSRT